MQFISTKILQQYFTQQTILTQDFLQGYNGVEEGLKKVPLLVGLHYYLRSLIKFKNKV